MAEEFDASVDTSDVDASADMDTSDVVDDVPDDTRLWKPETAPHATVTNKIGNIVPSFALLNPV